MISIIIPVFNPGDRFPALLDCVQRQTEGGFEVLLIDDGSTDGSEIVCDLYAHRDSRFHAIHQPNSGVSAARNRGLSEAKGEYITFLDADDEIPANYLSVLLETQRETRADVVACDVVVIQDGEEKKRSTKKFSVLEQKDALNLLLSRKDISTGPCAKLFHARVLDGAKFPPLCVYEDILFVRDVFSNAEKIAVTDQTEYRYIQNEGSAMHRHTSTPSLDIIVATDDLAEYICRHPELDPSCFYITISHMMQYAIPLMKSREGKNRAFLRVAMEELKKYQWKIIACRAFPWKEKALFIWYAYRYS